MMRHMPDARLPLAPLGDIFEARNIAAVGGRLMVDDMHAAVAQRHFRVRHPVRGPDTVAPSGVLLRGHLWSGAGGVAEINHLTQAHADPELRRGKVVHFGVPPVEQRQAALLVKHADTLLEAVEGKIA